MDDNVTEAQRPPNACAGSSCPCQDGEPCHYEDWQGTKAMERVSARVPPNAQDHGAAPTNLQLKPETVIRGSGESDCWPFFIL